MARMLGKKPYVADPRSLKLEKYALSLPAAPVSVNWASKVPTNTWGEMLNDSIGDCTCAAVGHIIQTLTANAGTVNILPDDVILQAYKAVSGYNPADGTNDNGAEIKDVLNYWKTTGFNDDKCGAFVEIDYTNTNLIKQAIDIFGAVDIGLQLPLATQGLTNVWSLPTADRRKKLSWLERFWRLVTNNPEIKMVSLKDTVTLTGNWAPGSWGGHCVPLVAYDANSFTCISWGKPVQITNDFFAAYCDEVWAVMSPDFISGNATTPSGFNLQQLQADLSQV